VAFDVKAKTVYQGKILFDVAEEQKLRQAGSPDGVFSFILKHRS
jgi:hypothetical protein